MTKFTKEFKVLKSEVIQSERTGFETFRKELIEIKTFYEGELYHTMYRVLAKNTEYKERYDAHLYINKTYKTKVWALKYFNKLNSWVQLEIIGQGGNEMTAKEALEIIERYSILNEIGQDEMQQDFDDALCIIKQSLDELEELKKSKKRKKRLLQN